MTFSRRLLLVLAFALPLAPLQAAGGWKATGPAGGDVSILDVDPAHPDVVYAEAGGLVRSRDGGDSWARLPLDVPYVAVLAVLPDSTVLLAASGENLYRSTDAGEHWMQLPEGLTGRYGFPAFATDFVVSAAEPGTVYLLVQGGELFRSDDGGVSWEILPIVPSGKEGSATSLAIDPGTPTTLYVSLSPWGVAKSLDRGAHWDFVNNGLESYLVEVWSVAVDPNAPSTVYAGLDRGVYRSGDGGAHWTEANAGIGQRNDIRRLSVDRVTSAAYAFDYGGTTYRSTDRGASWQTLRVVAATRCAPPQLQRVVLAGDGKGAYAGTYGNGALRSFDGGTSWRSVGVLGAMPTLSIAPDPSGPSSLFLTSPTDLFRSSDGGASWRAATPGAADSACASFVVTAADPRGSGLVYGIRGAYYGLLAPFNGEPLFRSADAGSTWAAAGPTPFIAPLALAVSPLDPLDLYLSVYGFYDVFARGSLTPNDRALYRSQDGGVSVSLESIPESNTRAIQFVVFDPRDPATVWAGGDGLFRKQASGDWTKLALPARALRSDLRFGLVKGIAVGRGGALYAAVTGAGVYRSLDDGVTWTDANGNLPSGIHPLDGTLLPAATSLAADASTGNLYLSAFTIFDPSIAGKVLVPGGVYESDDDGATWTLLGDGLPSAGVDQILLDRRAVPTLFAVTASGLFARDVSAPLRLDAISPANGSTAGGTLVILKGDGFRPDSVVAIGNVPTTELTFFDAQTLRVRTGAHATGAADVVVTNPDGQTSSLPGAFQYKDWTSCDPGSGTNLCLESGRFSVDVDWTDAKRPSSGKGHAEPLTIKSGYFWFEWNQDAQVTVKILDGRSQNGHYWIHVAAMTDLEFTVHVTDTTTGATKTYRNAAGQTTAVLDRESF